MNTKRTLSMAPAFLAVAAFITLGVKTANAQDQIPPPVPSRISFAMVGITTGQTLRVNASNVVAINDSGLPPGPTRVAIIVINSHGDPFRYRDGSPVRKVVMLERGDSAFLDLNGDDLQYPPGPTRIQLRAVVNVHPPPVPESGEVSPPVGDRIVTSIEVFNNTNGRTVFVMAAAPSVQKLTIPPPQPE